MSRAIEQKVAVDSAGRGLTNRAGNKSGVNARTHKKHNVATSIQNIDGTKVWRANQGGYDMV